MKKKVDKMSYVELLAFIGEINRPPGGKDSIRRLAQNCFVTKETKVLHAGCNTGYCSYELTHLTNCSIRAIDISPNMIKAANKFKLKDTHRKNLKFEVGDAQNLLFKDKSFDMVMSGGSTAFMKDRDKAAKEFYRVLKNWGFMSDINFYYHKKPPKKIIKDMNEMMGIKIESWGIDYWKNLYERAGFEEFYIYTNKAEHKTNKEVDDYAHKMSFDNKNIEISSNDRRKLKKRLREIFSLFNENHKYLSYFVFVYRKRPTGEQVALFEY